MLQSCLKVRTQQTWVQFQARFLCHAVQPHIFIFIYHNWSCCHSSLVYIDIYVHVCAAFRLWSITAQTVQSARASMIASTNEGKAWLIGLSASEMDTTLVYSVWVGLHLHNHPPTHIQIHVCAPGTCWQGSCSATLAEGVFTMWLPPTTAACLTEHLPT